jgi:hypothetical protein
VYRLRRLRLILHMRSCHRLLTCDTTSFPASQFRNTQPPTGTLTDAKQHQRAQQLALRLAMLVHTRVLAHLAVSPMGLNHGMHDVQNQSQTMVRWCAQWHMRTIQVAQHNTQSHDLPKGTLCICPTEHRPFRFPTPAPQGAHA